MNAFPYTYEEIKNCQKELNGLIDEIDKIEELIGLTKTAIHRYRVNWKEKLETLKPMINSVNDVSRKYVPLTNDTFNNQENNVDSINRRDNFKLMELETALDTLRKVDQTDMHFDKIIDDLKITKQKLEPLRSWRLYRLLKRLYERD